MRIKYAYVIGGVLLTAACGDKEGSDRNRVAGLAYPSDVPYELVVARENGDAGEITEEKEGLGLTEGLCNSRARYASYEYIEEVKIADYSDKTGADGGYVNNDNLIRMKPGSYNVNLTPGYKFGKFKENWRIWIDLNGDGRFDAKEMMLEASGIGSVAKDMTIPATAVRGKTKMRVSMRWGGFPNACGTFLFGEVQDYAIEITDKPWMNPVNKYDVNGDFCLTPLDLLNMSNALGSTKTGSLPGIKPPGKNFIDVNGSNSFTPLDSLTVVNAQNRGELKGCFEKPGQLVLRLPPLSVDQIAAGESFAVKWGADDCAPKMRAAEEAKKNNPNAPGFACALPGSAAPFDLKVDKNEKTVTYATKGDTDFNVVVNLVRPYVPANPNEVCVEGCVGEVIATAHLKANLKAGDYVTHQLKWSVQK